MELLLVALFGSFIGITLAVMGVTFIAMVECLYREHPYWMPIPLLVCAPIVAVLLKVIIIIGSAL